MQSGFFKWTRKCTHSCSWTRKSVKVVAHQMSSIIKKYNHSIKNKNTNLQWPGARKIIQLQSDNNGSHLKFCATLSQFVPNPASCSLMTKMDRQVKQQTNVIGHISSILGFAVKNTVYQGGERALSPCVFLYQIHQWMVHRRCNNKDLIAPTNTCLQDNMIIISRRRLDEGYFRRPWSSSDHKL